MSESIELAEEGWRGEGWEEGKSEEGAGEDGEREEGIGEIEERVRAEVGRREASVRVRFAAGIVALASEASVVRLPEDAIVRWRAAAVRPAGEVVGVAQLVPGDCVGVDLGGVWEQGVALGVTVRPVGEGRWAVDGDVRDYGAVEEAEGEHGVLVRGEAVEAAPALEDGPALGDPVTREELARVLRCGVDEVEAQVAGMGRTTYLRFVARAFAARTDMGTADVEEAEGRR